MKTLRILILATVAVFGPGVWMAVADDSPRCISLWPQIGGFESLAPNAALVQSATRDQVVGAMAHVAAYVERRDDQGRTTIDATPQQMFIFPTASGRYVVRFLDVASIPGWYYGYHAPY